MKILVLVAALAAQASFAQSAAVNVVLHPAGSFVAKTSSVKGAAVSKNGNFEAKNIIVDLKSLQTGIDLRDTHTKRHLEVDKFPQAVLVEAKGQNGKGTGTIRIRGVEKKIAGTYKVQGKNLVAEFPLSLADFDIKNVRYMGVGVDNTVQLTVSVPIQAERLPASK